MYRGFLETGKKFIDINGKIFSLVIALGIDRKIFYMQYEDDMLNFKSEDSLRNYIHHECEEEIESKYTHLNDVYEESSHRKNNQINDDIIDKFKETKEIKNLEKQVNHLKKSLNKDDFLGFIRGNLYLSFDKYQKSKSVNDYLDNIFYSNEMLKLGL